MKETVKEFLERGGKIEVIPRGVSANCDEDGLPVEPNKVMEASRKRGNKNSLGVRGLGLRSKFER